MHFRRNFIIYALITILVTQSLNLFLSTSSFEKTYRRSVLSQFEVLAFDLKSNIEEGLNRYKQFYNYAGIDRLFAEVLNHPDALIDSVFATDQEGKILYLSYQDNDQLPFKRYEIKDNTFLHDDIIDDFSLPVSNTVIHHRKNTYLINSPIKNEGTWLGNISLVFSENVITNKVKTVVIQGLWYYLLVILLSGVLLMTAAMFLLKKQLMEVQKPNADRFNKKQKNRSIAILIFVLICGQATFSFFNLRSFQSYYLDSILNRSDLLISLLKEDVSFLLRKGLPIKKLVNIETSMKRFVSSSPEYSSLSIINSQGDLLYLADTRDINEDRLHKTGAQTRDFDLAGKYNLFFPVVSPDNPEKTVGYINLVLNREYISNTTRKVLIDYLTVILIAVLISFEMGAFFISKSFLALYTRKEDDREQPRIPIAMIRSMGFLSLFSTYLFMPFFPLYCELMSRPILGLSREFVTGLPIAVYMFASAIGFILKSTLNHRFGHRETYFIGSILFGAGLIITGFIHRIEFLILAQCLSGIGFGIIYLIPQSLIMETPHAERRQIGLSRLFSGFFSGIICGSAIGGLLAERLGYRSVFFVAVVIIFCSALFSYLNVFRYAGKVKPKTRIPPTTDTLISPLQLIKDWRYTLPLLAQGIPYQLIYVGFLFFLLPLYLRSLGFSESDTGRVIMLHGIIIVGGPLILRFLSHWLTRKVQLVTASLISAMMLIGTKILFDMATFSSLMVILVPWIGIIAVCNCIQGSTIATIALDCPTARKMGAGEALGVYRILERSGSVLAPILCSSLIGFFYQAGMVHQHFEYSIAVIGVIMLLGALIFAGSKIRTPM